MPNPYLVIANKITWNNKNREIFNQNWSSNNEIKHRNGESDYKPLELWNLSQRGKTEIENGENRTAYTDYVDKNKIKTRKMNPPANGTVIDRSDLFFTESLVFFTWPIYSSKVRRADKPFDSSRWNCFFSSLMVEEDDWWRIVLMPAPD